MGHRAAPLKRPAGFCCKGGVDRAPEIGEGKETNILNTSFMPGAGLDRTETVCTKHLLCASHWLRVFTDPDYKEEYNAIPAFREGPSPRVCGY